MLVQDLIEILETLDPDAEVLLGTQPSYPIETTIRSVVTRKEYDEDTKNPNEVLILEGRQMGYGCKTAWEVY